MKVENILTVKLLFSKYRGGKYIFKVVHNERKYLIKLMQEGKPCILFVSLKQNPFCAVLIMKKVLIGS